MTPRILWFVAGTAAGAYAAVKARRAAYRVSTPGLIDQAAALGTGWREFRAEYSEGRDAHEADLSRRLAQNPTPPPETLSIEKDQH